MKDLQYGRALSSRSESSEQLRSNTLKTSVDLLLPRMKVIQEEDDQETSQLVTSQLRVVKTFKAES